MKADAKKKMAKMDMEEKDPKAGEDEEEEEEAEKSELTESDLEKSLAKLVAMAGDTEVSRKDTLLAKAQSDSLDDEERNELFGILGGYTLADSDFADEISKSLESITDDEDVQQVLDVTGYLAKSHEEMVKALVEVAAKVESQDRRDHEFNIVLAKSIHGLTRLVQDIGARLEVVESAPARGPKSLGAAPLAKSFAGQPSSEDSITKAEAIQALGSMMEKAMAEGREGDANRFLHETAKIEQTRRVDESVAQEIKHFRAAR